MRLEHHVELTDRSKIAFPADGADHLVGVHEFVHLLKAHAVDVDIGILPFDEFIGAMAGFAGFAIDHRVIESRNVAGRLPHLRIHENRGIDADVRRRFLDEFLPPH